MKSVVSAQFRKRRGRGTDETRYERRTRTARRTERRDVAPLRVALDGVVLDGRGGIFEIVAAFEIDRVNRVFERAPERFGKFKGFFLVGSADDKSNRGTKRRIADRTPSR